MISERFNARSVWRYTFINVFWLILNHFIQQVLCKKGRGAIRVLQAKMFAEAEKCALKDSTKFETFVYILSVHVIRVETTCCCFQVVIVSFHSESFIES